MNVVILGSGRGSNAEVILKKWKHGDLANVRPVAIISDNPDAPILELGSEFGIDARYLNAGKFKTKLDQEAEQRYIETIQSYEPHLIVLAGFMRVIKQPFLDAFPKQIINLHPSLLPSFKGLDGIRQAYEYGVKITGCTVHYVTGELDGGPIIDQSAIEIDTGDSLEIVEAKVHAAEHDLLPSVLRKLSLK